MKYLYVTTISNTVNAFLVPHVKMLIEEGNKVDIACNIDQEISQELVSLGCKVFNIPFSRNPISIGNLKSYSIIKNIISKGKYDVLHTHTPIASMISRISVNRNIDLEIIYTAHGFHFYKGASKLNWLVYYPIERILSKKTNKLITINTEDYERSISSLKSKRSYLINGVGVDSKKFNISNIQELKMARLKSEKFTLLMVGELNNNKNHLMIIKSVIRLKKKISNLELIILGEGPNFKLYEEYIIKNNALSYVHLKGYSKDVVNYMKSSNVLVSASFREGLPVNVIEALFLHLPIIVSDCRGNRDLVNGKNGLMFDMNSIESFENNFISLYNNYEKYLNHSFNESYNFSTSNILPDLSKIYKD